MVLDWVSFLIMSVLLNEVLCAGWLSVLSDVLQLTLTLRLSCRYRRTRLVTYLIESRRMRPVFEDAVACGNHVPTLSVLLRRFPELATKQTNDKGRSSSTASRCTSLLLSSLWFIVGVQRFQHYAAVIPLSPFTRIFKFLAALGSTDQEGLIQHNR